MRNIHTVWYIFGHDTRKMGRKMNRNEQDGTDLNLIVIYIKTYI